MSTDYAEKEREFLASLEEDTGRDLAAWMRAIDDKRLTEKNDIIDWLRQQGFMFWKASWLERIHSNGGQPIYGDGVAAPAAETADVPPKPAPEPQPTAQSRVADAPDVPLAIRPEVPAAAPAMDPDLEALLAKAKALRPLARHILKEIAKIAPASTFTAAAGYVSIANPAEGAVLTISPRELRLGLALAGTPAAAPLAAARFAAPGLRVSSAITHMVVLTDARQIDRALLGWVEKALAPAGQIRSGGAL